MPGRTPPRRTRARSTCGSTILCSLLPSSNGDTRGRGCAEERAKQLPPVRLVEPSFDTVVIRTLNGRAGHLDVEAAPSTLAVGLRSRPCSRSPRRRHRSRRPPRPPPSATVSRARTGYAATGSPQRGPRARQPAPDGDGSCGPDDVVDAHERGALEGAHMAFDDYFAHDDPAPPVARTVPDRLSACGSPPPRRAGARTSRGATRRPIQ